MYDRGANRGRSVYTLRASCVGNTFKFDPKLPRRDNVVKYVTRCGVKMQKMGPIRVSCLPSSLSKDGLVIRLRMCQGRVTAAAALHE